MPIAKYEDVPLRLPSDVLERMQETARIEGVTLSELVAAVFE